MSKAARIHDYLGHILLAIDRIGRYTASLDEADFLRSELVQDAVIRNIEIIGEAANSVQRADPAFAALHGDIPWQVMYTMRNRVSHAYDKVDLEIVWNTVRTDLPGLRLLIQNLQTSIAAPPADMPRSG